MTTYSSNELKLVTQEQRPLMNVVASEMQENGLLGRMLDSNNFALKTVALSSIVAYSFTIGALVSEFNHNQHNKRI
ncbi:MAG: hypothetical protein NVS1B10_01660 [Candidatus Saccharimonadales bacterium]